MENIMGILSHLALAFKGGGQSPKPQLAPPSGRFFYAQSQPYGVVYGGNKGASGQGYAAMLRAAYLENPVAQRSVRIIADSVGNAPLSGDERAQNLLNGAVQGSPLLGLIASHIMLHGNAYVHIICGADGRPDSLYALRPDRVTVETDENGWPETYLYQIGDKINNISAFGADGRPQIVHIRSFHPDDDHYGLGCLGAAAEAVAIHNAASRWNRSLLDNAARPSGALVYDPGEAGAVLSTEQFDRLKAELEASYSGADNAGRPLLLEGGLKWQGISLTPADMDFVALKAAAAREIALAFGVPPMMIGLPGDNAYANYREANRALWRLTILPLLDSILDGVNAALSAWPDTGNAGDGTRDNLRVELEQIPAFSEDRERLWSRINAADFLSDAEKRVAVGMARRGDEGDGGAESNGGA
jgi:HK97 family phage portal protein